MIIDCDDFVEAPGAPIDVEWSDSSHKLSWNAPGYDGGSPIAGYYVEISNDGYRWEKLNTMPIEISSKSVPVLSAPIRLKSSKSKIRVCAVNEAGLQGPPTDAKLHPSPTPSPSPPPGQWIATTMISISRHRQC